MSAVPGTDPNQPKTKGQFIFHGELAFPFQRKEYMKRIILLVLLMATQAQGSLFNRQEDDRVMREYQQQLERERHSAGGWQLVAGVFGLGAIILFGVGTAIGSKTRKEVKADE